MLAGTLLFATKSQKGLNGDNQFGIEPLAPNFVQRHTNPSSARGSGYPWPLELLPLRPDGATPSGTGKPYFRISRRIGRRERPQAEQARPYLGFFLQLPPGLPGNTLSQALLPFERDHPSLECRP